MKDKDEGAVSRHFHVSTIVEMAYFPVFAMAKV